VAPGIGSIENGQGWLRPCRLLAQGQNHKAYPNR
jgi:hypothetical protein